MKKQLVYSLITGAILGIVCILGATLRYQDDVSVLYLFSFWFNRVLMGLVIGLADRESPIKQRLMIGAGLGLFVSFAFYSATSFKDPVGFLVGAIYGIIIVLVINYVNKKPNKLS